jgi:DHA1 family multidrug resistance protein-like MFS transporter
MSSTYGVMFTMLDDYRDKYGISESGLGLVLAVGFFSAFFSQISIAPWADRGRAKVLMMTGFLLVIIGCLFMGFGQNFALLLIGRLLMGIGGGMSLPALRKIVIVSDPENLGGNMGKLLSVDIAGFALGPVISVLTVDTIGIAAPFVIIASAVLVVTVVLSRVAVPETAKADRPTERLAFDLLKIPAVSGAILIGVSLFLMIGTFDSLWSIMMDDLEGPEWMANAGVSLFALPMIFLGPIGGRLAQHRGAYRVGAIGSIVGAGCMTMYGFLPSPYLMMGVFFLHILNDGFSITSSGVAVSQAAPVERQAGAQGLLGGLQTLTGGIAASFAGWSYDHLGRGTTFAITAIVMVILVLSGLVLAGPEHRRAPSAVPTS